MAKKEEARGKKEEGGVFEGEEGWDLNAHYAVGRWK